MCVSSNSNIVFPFKICNTNIKDNIIKYKDVYLMLYGNLPIWNISKWKLLIYDDRKFSGVNTGCFQHWYTDFGHTNLGVHIIDIN